MKLSKDGLRQDRSPPDRAKRDLAARFATPIETDKPVNPEEQEPQPFSPIPEAEDTSDKRR